jgi:transcriptional regulator with XRE-family HTH domain
VPQKEIAALLKVDPNTVSKFESAKQDVKLDFLIFYAALLGYNIKVGSTFRSWGEPSRFRRRQSRIAQALRCIERWQIEEIFNSGAHWYAIWPGDDVGKNMSRIISELRYAKKSVGLTSQKSSEELGVTERTIRRFEREESTPSASLAFKYAALVNMELRLEKNLRCKSETLGAFYIRRGLVLYHWIRSLADTTSSGV